MKASCGWAGGELELDHSMLSTSIHTDDPRALEGRQQLALRDAAKDVIMGQLRAQDGAADQVRTEIANDGLYFGEFGHEEIKAGWRVGG